MIQLTDNAISRIIKVIEREKNLAGLRLAVRGGGCDGLTYHIQFETEAKPRDNVFDYNGAKVFVDPKSLVYLQDLVVDYQETFMQQGFVFQNPQAKHSCSCGTSFSV
jgi:iron-sulfur cluster assembly protein